jgi:putative salt-induced outer membrane protein YdiY
MKNRMNVYWNGRRTTASFPPELWQLAKLAKENDDDSVSDYVQNFLNRYDHAPRALSASAIARVALYCAVLHRLPGGAYFDLPLFR